MDILGFEDKFFLISIMSFLILNILGSLVGTVWRRILQKSKDEHVRFNDLMMLIIVTSQNCFSI